jgi:hypothetical protein
MLPLYLHRLIMLFVLVGITLLSLYFRRRAWLICMVGLALASLVFFTPNPLRVRIHAFQQKLMIELYRTKYVGKDLSYAQAELGVPVNVMQASGRSVWEYADFSIASHDNREVTTLQTLSTIFGD